MEDRALLATNLSIVATNANLAEGTSGSTAFAFAVTRIGVTTGISSVRYTVAGSGANAANSADFGTAFPSGTVTFMAGETSKPVTVNVRGDTAVEPNEGFKVMLSSPSGATISTTMALGTILNDDAQLALTATSATKAEGNSGTTPFMFAVTRTGDMNRESDVDYAVTSALTNGANADDFGGSLPSGNVHFNVGEKAKPIRIDVTGDRTVEVNEGF